MTKHKTCAIILAAGQSSRMKTLKPILNIENKPAIIRLVDTFKAAGIEDITIIVGYHADRLKETLASYHLNYQLNPQPSEGMFSSIQAGLSKLDQTYEGVFIIPADIPLIKESTLMQLLECFNQHPSSIILPTCLGQTGHPVLISKKYITKILEASKEAHLNYLLETWQEDCIEMPCFDQSILMDMDTPEAYKEILSFAKTQHYPSKELCYMIWERYHLSENIRQHSIAVASIAVRLAKALNQTGIEPINIPKLEAAALLHDIVRKEKNHAEKGADLLIDIGFPEIAPAVAAHMTLDFKGEITYVELLYLSDKLSRHHQYCPLEERLAEMRTLYPAHQAEIEKRFSTAMAIKLEVERLLAINDLYQYLNLF